MPRSSPELARLRPDRDLTDEEFMLQYADYWKLRRDASARRPMMPALGVGAGGITTLALMAVTLPSLLGGRSASPHVDSVTLRADVSQPSVDHLVQRVPSLAHVVKTPRAPARPAPRAAAKPASSHVSAPTPAPVHHTAPDTQKPATVTHRPAVHKVHTASVQHAHPAKHTPVTHAPATAHSATAVHHAASDTPKHTAASPAGGYVNPLAHASLTPERVDQGVDYSGSGTLTALGAGTVTYVATSGTGWPGAFIEYRLSSGPDAGRYVYYAEEISPASGLHVGQNVSPGQAIATVSGGIEIGWGAGIGTETYARSIGEWSSSMDSSDAPTAAGKSFSALIASLGGPPGIVRG
ncbi:MAG: hypothetical protein ACJ764_02420 [Solirubrobacteraceae bacterium]